MELDRIGYNHAHGKEFVIDIPVENSWWLFLLIKTPAIFRIDGVEVHTKPNSFILYSYGMAQHYRADDGPYIDDWFHLMVYQDDIEYFKSLGIPINKVVELPDANEISMLIRSMAYEFYGDSKYNKRILGSFMNILFLKLSRQLYSDEATANPLSSAHYDALLTIRNDIFAAPQKRWSVDEAAELVSVSRSTFQHEYKKLFRVNFSADVIASRLRRAKYYLTTTDLTVSEIAELCGYNSDVFFMKQFKKFVGQSPTAFRHKI